MKECHLFFNSFSDYMFNFKAKADVTLLLLHIIF